MSNDDIKELQRRMGEAEKQTALANQSIRLMTDNLALMRQTLDELTRQHSTLALLKHRIDSVEQQTAELRGRLKEVKQVQSRAEGARAGANWLITAFPKIGQILLWIVVGLLALSSFWPLGGKGS
ncbi:hypothetical protein I6M49_22285 [Shewanella algae]|uniref:hypothetical protein n=1 Tax=Shewanella algae TaxID=38313 RepID=UPI001AAD5905|nr:hypothetical protein [Shewanella algae]MBO2656175.1 hypothetical protein [Shewanella algae]